MNTKKAIKFLEEIQDENMELQEEGHNKLLLEVIALLKRSEAYEQITEEVTSKYGHIITHREGIFIKETLKDVIKNLEQKYLPKE